MKSVVKKSDSETLPAGWTIKTAGEIAEIKLGKMLDRAKHISGTALPYLRNINVRWDEFDTTDLREMFFDDDEVDRYSVRSGDLIVCEGGEPGRAAIWKGKKPTMFQKALHRVRPTDAVTAEWMLVCLRHYASSGELMRFVSGTTIKHFTLEAFSRLPIPLPPLLEQRRIVARLEALTARSRRARALLAEVPTQLAQARQSLLASAFRGDLTADWRRSNQPKETGIALLNRLQSERRKNWEASEFQKMCARGRRPKDATWKSHYVEPIVSTCADPLPTTWTWACLIELEEGDRKSGYGVLKPGPHEPTGIRMLKSGQIRHGWVDLSEDYRISPELDTEFAKTRLRGGEVLINLVGASIGRSAVAPAETAGYNLSRAIGMIPVPQKIAVYVQLVLGSPVCQRLIAGKTGGSAQGVLNMEEVRSLEIPLPSEVEQHEIVRRLQSAFARLDAAAAAHTGAVAELDRLDQSLLTRAFSGAL